MQSKDRKVFKKLAEAEAETLYSKGMSMKEIQHALHVSYKSLVEYLNYCKVPIRAPKRRESLREPPTVGQRFGNWTVISDELKSGGELTTNPNNRALYWKVQCDCGYVGWRNPHQLKTGKSTRCKRCGRIGIYENGEPRTVSGLIKSKYRQLKQGLSTRKKVSNLNFDLSVADLQDLYEKSQICALSGLDITLDYSKTLQEQNLSVDRIDSSIGYTKSNIQLVDKRINMMKGTLSNEEFIMLCTAVADYNRNRTKHT